LKLGSLVNLILFNGVAAVLAALVYDDRVWRAGYWHSMGFTPTTTYYPLFYVTSAVNGATSIPGTLTVDWLQVILVAAIVLDGLALASAVLGRRRKAAIASMPKGAGAA